MPPIQRDHGPDQSQPATVPQSRIHGELTMPNWCENNVSIEGTTEAMQYFLDNYCVQDPNSESMYRISFEKIIPIEQMPDEEGKCKGFAQIEHQVEAFTQAVNIAPVTQIAADGVIIDDRKPAIR